MPFSQRRLGEELPATPQAEAKLGSSSIDPGLATHRFGLSVLLAIQISRLSCGKAEKHEYSRQVGNHLGNLRSILSWQAGDRDSGTVIDPAGLIDHEALGRVREIARALRHEDEAGDQKNDRDNGQKLAHT